MMYLRHNRVGTLPPLCQPGVHGNGYHRQEELQYSEACTVTSLLYIKGDLPKENEAQPAQSWNTCGNRYMNLTLKWMAECTTVKDVSELLAIDAVTKLMPRPISNHVRDHSPATLTDATKLADCFMQTRGCSYDQTGDNEGRSYEANRKSINH